MAFPNLVVKEDVEAIAAQRLPWDMLEGKTILISGANGFLPSYLVETILHLNETRFAKKATVMALVRNWDRACEKYKHHKKNREDLRFLLLDVTDPLEDIKAVVEGQVDYVVHAASQASPKYYVTDPVGTILANTVGTNNLLELAREKKSEGFLFFSSGEVYGNLCADGRLVDESTIGVVDPVDVRSCYGESKRAGETMCVSYFKQYNVPAKMVRPFHTYGPGISLDDGRVFADFVNNIIHGANIVMKSDGSAVRTFTYVSDATAGFFTALLKGRDGEPYNVANGLGTISIKGLAEVLVDLYPEKKLRVVTCEKPDESKQYLKSKIAGFVPDARKLMKLGWLPTIGIAEGFKRMIESYSGVS